MSTTDTAERGDFPEFELSYLYDDTEDPTEVTVFSGNDDAELPTRWISVDVDHAVALEKTP